ncbi:MAG: PQQ-binding-like beta-propeller repeat protein [Actinobacteria bacterium]|nr:PQQ-binding-like beta-propeller repeat protein [Actinomycetota bacterium]
MLLAVGWALAALGPASGQPEPAPGGVVWSQFQGDPAHSGWVAGGGVEPPLEVAWRFDDPEGSAGTSDPVIWNDLALTVGRTAVYGVDLATGEFRFSVPRIESPLTEPALGVTDGRTLLVYSEGPDGSAGTTDGEGDAEADAEADPVGSTVVGLDLETGEAAWRLQLEGDSRSGVAVEGTVAYVGDRRGDVHAIDLATGDPVWTYDGTGDVDVTPAAAGGRVYAVSLDRAAGSVSLVALDAADGALVWKYEPGRFGAASTVPTVGADALYLGLRRHVVALDLEDGAQLWSSPVRGFFLFPGAALADGSELYVAEAQEVAGVQGAVYRLDPATGARIWDFQLEDAILASAPVVVGDTLFVGLSAGGLVALDRTTGHRTFRVESGLDEPLGAIAVGDGILVARQASRTGGLVAFRSGGGQPITDVASPTEFRTENLLRDLGPALLGLFAGFYLLSRGLLRDRLLGPPPRPVGPDEPEGPEL